MMTRRVFFSVPFVVMMAANGLAENECVSFEAALTLLRSSNVCDNRAGFLALHTGGKEAIPALIAAITDTSSSSMLLVDPRSATISESAMTARFGLVAAYAIELILGRESLGTPTNRHFPLAYDDYMYDSVEIVRRADGKIESRFDLIQDGYLQWWRKNRQKSLEELRAEWKEERGPLAEAGLKWR